MPVVYEIDAALRLTGVNERWCEFARENDAPGLLPPSVLGRPVLAGSDLTTVHVYRQLFDRVRATAVPVSFGIRCDGPALRRWLKLTIASRGGGFEVQSLLERAEPREAVALLVAPRLDDGSVVHMCSWCKRCDAGGAWLEVEDAVRALGLFEREVLPAISHGMCDDCYRGMEAYLR